MSAPASNHSESAGRYFGNGVIVFDQYELVSVDRPLIPGATGKAADLILPASIQGGKGIFKETSEGQKVIKQDTSVIYGRVKGCGLDAHRGNYEPFPPEKQTWFPLPVGTYFTARRFPIWTNHDDELCIDTCYAIEYWFPCEHRNKTTGEVAQPSRPSWAPEE